MTGRYVNLIASVADRLPWGRMRIGFLVTHLSILVIFAGALTTEIAKIDGSLGLWEGQSSDVIYVQGDGQTFDSVPLGFTIRLDAFEIDHYPGTRRPAMFRSRVTVVDPETGEQEQRVIETVIKDEPHALAAMTRKLADSGVNIEAMYLLHSNEEGLRFAVAIDDADTAQRVAK